MGFMLRGRSLAVRFKFYKHYIWIALLLIESNALAAITCSNPKEECVEAGETRYFDGASLTLPCWKYKTTYECIADTDNSCDELRNQKCYQASTSCKVTWNNGCAVQEEVFKCPIKKCKEIEEDICMDNISCLDGNCIETMATKNQNFGKAASNLAVLAAAASEFKENNKDQDIVKNPHIFTGKSMECSKNIIGFKSCCGISGSGWGEGWLASCDAEEKELAQKRGSDLAVRVGDYCYNKVLGKCTSRHYVYCVFPSKIARIIQESGRRDQLHLSFGDVGGDHSNPDCRGITPEELSKINFDLIDFSELVNDLLKVPDQAKHPETKFKEAVAKVNYEDMKKRSANSVVSSQQQAAGRIRDFYDRAKK
jgi:conjugal transfer mating pair stabilization protein TraN